MQAGRIRAADKPLPKQGPPGEPARGFLERLYLFFAGGEEPEKARRRLLKDIGKQLKGGRYKFYQPKSEEALPALARFFYEIYRVIGPAHVLLDRADSSSVLKAMIIEKGVGASTVELKAYLGEEQIRARANSMGAKELASDLQAKLTIFESVFDAVRVKQINSLYELLSIFLELLRFDYHFFLKKFDPNLPDYDFKYVPRFDRVNGEHVVEELKDFLAVISAFDPAADWSALFDVLADYRESEVVTRAAWTKLQRTLSEVRASRVLELIVRYVDRDPSYKVRAVAFGEDIVHDYLAKLRSEAEATLQKVAREGWDNKVAQLTRSIFGAIEQERLRNYTERESGLFSARLLGSYQYVPHLGYLKTFLLDLYKKDIRDLLDLLILRGRWATPVTSQQLSEAYHLLLEASDEIIAFDDSLSPQGDIGVRIHALVHRAERDKAAATSLRQTLREINGQAQAIVRKAAQNLVALGRNLKIVLDDRQKGGITLLTNWKEIETLSDGKIQARIVDAYKKIYYFVQLLQLLLKEES